MTRRAVWLLGLVAGCVQGNPAVDPDALDAPAFRCLVEPVLARRCAFPACHGDPRRPFRLYAPNRLRRGLPSDALGTPLTPEEHADNQLVAARFASPAAGYDEPLLVAKPLAARLGGASHGAVRRAGGEDVFESLDDPELAALLVWIAGAAEDPGCVP